jgi:THO complex subunit 2
MPEEGWKALSVELYETFWSLSLYDIYVPKQRYETEISRLRNAVEAIQKSFRNDKERATPAAKLDVANKLQTIADLKEELAAQQANCRAITRRIKEEVGTFLSNLDASEVNDNTAKALLSYCVYPRCLLTPEDALFCAKFVQLLTTYDCPHFPTLQYYDVFNKSLGPVLFCVTETEAANLGVLLRETWRVLGVWRYDKEVYESEAMIKKGFRVGEDSIAHTKVS